MILVAAIMFMEPSVIPYTKETIESFVSNYGRGWVNMAKVLHCLCIFSMPIIAKSPLTMLPLIGLVIALMVTFYTKQTYKKVVYIPEIFLCVTALLYLSCKVQSFGLYVDVGWIKSIVKFICSYSDSKQIV